jgi:aminoglycoside 2'-N-acetyltransferase I
MISTLTTHTADLSASRLADIRGLLGEAFEGRWDADDWEHTLGGMHVVTYDDDRPIAHAAVVQRRLIVAGVSLRAGYVEAVAVAANRRGRGYAAGVMAEAERIVRGGYAIGALSAGERVAGLYTARGWQRWCGDTAVLTPTGVVRTPDDDDSTYVLAVAESWELTGTLVCDWRPGDIW